MLMLLCRYWNFAFNLDIINCYYFMGICSFRFWEGGVKLSKSWATIPLILRELWWLIYCPRVKDWLLAFMLSREMSKLSKGGAEASSFFYFSGLIPEVMRSTEKLLICRNWSNCSILLARFLLLLVFFMPLLEDPDAATDILSFPPFLKLYRVPLPLIPTLLR